LKDYTEQKIRPAGGRRSPRTSELRSQAADKIVRFLSGNKEEARSNKKFLEFARMSGEDKVAFLKQKLYKLYDQKLQLCEEELSTDLIDRDIDRLEQQIQDIQTDMWE